MENREITMVRLDLDGVPDAEIPEPYRLRWYNAGDEAHWTAIQRAADRYNTITPDLFRREFGEDDAALADRQAYLQIDDEAPVATATAWYTDDRGGLPWGRIHWVAVAPEHQGKGLAKPLLTCVLRRMRNLGHDRAYLTTSTARIPAINLYLQFGFVPEVRTVEARVAWRLVRQQLPHPVLDMI